MKTNILLRQTTIDDKTRAIIEKKVAKLDKFFRNETAASVTISKQRDKEKLELTISQRGRIFRSEVLAEDASHAIDTAVATVERQIRKNKTRLEKSLREGAFLKNVDEPVEEDVEEEKEFEIRRKDLRLDPMSADEAILQMNLSEHSFFVFKDADTGAVCVVYKRHEDSYGLIVTNN
ncbi:MAG: ribosome-associated translation inhibitor RaiA [Clostridia bacterium]|nr:ribosome-associated translation inhibitor RaiA [Clostridia bacterium]MBO4429146.1 ribosome-associated translation inhibitor RaiA [Clostridia bacterium]